MIRSTKELKVWMDAMDLAMEIFLATKSFPLEERYSLTDQIRRSSRSVAANIAEAWRKRRYQAAFISKLSDAEGEASETQTWIELGRRCGYFTDEAAHHLYSRYDEILSQLVYMITTANKWCQGLTKPPS
ncbi:MAG TPA: four helix bundle protein [Tepidisphaeraceae bacterium]|nr:four helix bundle protein [Tepidisphaeraceae bacterium]